MYIGVLGIKLFGLVAGGLGASAQPRRASGPSQPSQAGGARGERGTLRRGSKSRNEGNKNRALPGQPAPPRPAPSAFHPPAAQHLRGLTDRPHKAGQGRPAPPPPQPPQAPRARARPSRSARDGAAPRWGCEPRGCGTPRRQGQAAGGSPLSARTGPRGGAEPPGAPRSRHPPPPSPGGAAAPSLTAALPARRPASPPSPHHFREASSQLAARRDVRLRARRRTHGEGREGEAQPTAGAPRGWRGAEPPRGGCGEGWRRAEAWRGQGVPRLQRPPAAGRGGRGAAAAILWLGLARPWQCLGLGWRCPCPGQGGTGDL
ncbi:hypothetical protein LUU34_00403900 [Aix galericulata]|nr:hypothetical protein LUU34_00403900 [Aix galericulata]